MKFHICRMRTICPYHFQSPSLSLLLFQGLPGLMPLSQEPSPPSALLRGSAQAWVLPLLLAPTGISTWDGFSFPLSNWSALSGGLPLLPQPQRGACLLVLFCALCTSASTSARLSGEITWKEPFDSETVQFWVSYLLLLGQLSPSLSGDHLYLDNETSPFQGHVWLCRKRVLEVIQPTQRSQTSSLQAFCALLCI